MPLPRVRANCWAKRASACTDFPGSLSDGDSASVANGWAKRACAADRHASAPYSHAAANRYATAPHAWAKRACATNCWAKRAVAHRDRGPDGDASERFPADR